MLLTVANYSDKGITVHGQRHRWVRDLNELRRLQSAPSSINKEIFSGYLVWKKNLLDGVMSQRDPNLTPSLIYGERLTRLC